MYIAHFRKMYPQIIGSLKPELCYKYSYQGLKLIWKNIRLKSTQKGYHLSPCFDNCSQQGLVNINALHCPWSAAFPSRPVISQLFWWQDLENQYLNWQNHAYRKKGRIFIYPIKSCFPLLLKLKHSIIKGLSCVNKYRHGRYNLMSNSK